MLVINLEKGNIPVDSKFEVLFVLCGVKAFTIIQDSTSYNEAITILDHKFQKWSTAIVMHHKLRSLKQHKGESVKTLCAT